MGNPGPQHELACTLVQRYPNLMMRLGDIAGVKIPEHDQTEAASNSHQLPNRPPLDGDGTIRFLRDKKTRIGGHMIVLSPDAGEAAKFRRSESQLGGEYAYRGSCLSRADLKPLAEKGRSFEERCFAS